MTRTPDYDLALKATQDFHTREKGFSGRFLLRYLEDVKHLCDHYAVASMLDYGCGRGAQYEGAPIEVKTLGGVANMSVQNWLGITHLAKYDPGYPPFAGEPEGKFDLVICTQVLGSIPISDLQWVIERICAYATCAVYFAESLVEAPRKQLHRNLRGKMPHGWTREQWSEVIAEGSREFPDMPVFLRTKDKTVPKGERTLAVFHAGTGSIYHLT